VATGGIGNRTSSNLSAAFPNLGKRVLADRVRFPSMTAPYPDPAAGADSIDILRMWTSISGELRPEDFVLKAITA